VKKIPVKVVYRSKGIQMPLMAAMEASNAWDKAGLDLQSLQFVSGAAQSDPKLMSGECDFIFGSHISPYIHRANGSPWVYIGQTVNWCDDVLVTREPVHDLTWLRGKTIAERNTKLSNHPYGNHKVYLRRAGVDLTEVGWVGADDQGKMSPTHEMVAEGLADAAFIGYPDDIEARELGLHVLQVPWLPMVLATSLTTMWPTTQERPDLCRGIIRAVREGIRFFKEEETTMMKILETDVGPKLGIQSEEVLRGLWERNCQLLDERLYPKPEAVQNAYRIAELGQPDLGKKVNPMELWDVHFLRETEATK
jgi:hypothetical protein